jgi:hypothetical protein
MFVAGNWKCHILGGAQPRADIDNGWLGIRHSRDPSIRCNSRNCVVFPVIPSPAALHLMSSLQLPYRNDGSLDRRSSRQR